MQKIVGLIGTKGAGKDTAAEFFYKKGFKGLAYADALYKEVEDAFSITRQELSNRATKESPSMRLSLKVCADPSFKEKMVSKLKTKAIEINTGIETLDSFLSKSNWEEEFLSMPQSPRTILQWWGSQYKRDLSKNYWTDKVVSIIKNNSGLNFIITDVRFLNEAEVVTSFGGVTIRVKRKSIDAELAKRIASGDPNSCHISETQLLSYKTDFEVENIENNLDSLGTAIEELFKDETPNLAIVHNPEKRNYFIK